MTDLVQIRQRDKSLEARNMHLAAFFTSTMISGGELANGGTGMSRGG